MLALAESREEVIRTLQKDVYFKSGIWNWDQVQIHPVSGISRGSTQSSSTNQRSSNLRSGNLFDVPMVSSGLRNPCKWCYNMICLQIYLLLLNASFTNSGGRVYELIYSTQRCNTYIICAHIYAA